MGGSTELVESPVKSLAGLRSILAISIASLGCALAEANLESDYPLPVNLSRVGEYPALSKSGGGYFYDDVLEYRVWIQNPDGDDYYRAFVTFETALEYSNNTEHAEPPLVLVRQREWINEPEPNHYLHEKGERVTEWRVEWLAEGKRGPDSIRRLLSESAGNR